MNAVWPRLRHAEVPSELIQAEIRRVRSGAAQAEGGEFTDSYLACLSCYLDAIVVDKETHEYLTQCTRRNSSFGRMIGFFTKVSSYRDLANALVARRDQSCDSLH